ncbi:hypothetical protein LCGC14_0211700 [marine sediment metagenome]|uniref:Uncharacterized protein n=1 Tax=marine sediment metagenome TaxID=412755 RepID=A0A0F9UX84_9ZZZZ
MKGSPSTNTVRWAGKAWVGTGIGIFHGRAGHQEWHTIRRIRFQWASTHLYRLKPRWAFKQGQPSLSPRA